MKMAKTGIIYFTRTSNKEARSKKWHPSFSTNLKIANHLIESTKEILLETGFDVITIDERSQRGATFGDKISSAFEDVFLQGYESLVLVGNDSIGLTSKSITQSIEELLAQPMVYGSTVDDGIYLIGFQKTFFDKNNAKIANLPWRRNGLIQATSNLSDLNSSNSLPVLSDLNSIRDINSILKFSQGADEFIESLRAIIHGGANDVIGHPSNRIESYFISSTIKKRGPPSQHIM